MSANVQHAEEPHTGNGEVPPLADLIACSLTFCIAIGALAGGMLSGPPLGAILGAVIGGTVGLIFCVLRM